MLSSFRPFVVATALLALVVGSASAATTVNIVEKGEAGGLMSLEIDQAQVHAGATVFNVKNDAKSEVHEFILVRLDDPSAKVPVDPKTHRVDEAGLNSLGEVEDLKPGASGSLSADLKPGTYLLFCNIEGHYESGMQAKLTVVE